MYRLITIKEPNMPEITTLQRISDTAFIPMNPDNTDYREYLKWVDEGNEPIKVEK
jgi:hypothetical protein